MFVLKRSQNCPATMLQWAESITKPFGLQISRRLPCSTPTTLGNKTPPTTLGNKTPPTTLGNKTPPTTLGNKTPPTTLGNKTPPTTLGNKTPPTTLGNKTPPTTLGNKTPPTTLGNNCAVDIWGYWANFFFGLVILFVISFLYKVQATPLISDLYNPDFRIKGQMHHHDDLGSKCAYTCHLSNKTTRKSVLLSTPQIWLMKVSKKLAWVWVWRLTLSEVVLMKWLPALLLIGWEISVAATDISQPIRSRAGSHFISTTSDNVSLHTHTQASFLLTFISHIWGVLRRTDLRVVLFERWHI